MQADQSHISMKPVLGDSLGRSLFASMPDAVCLHDAAGALLEANACFCEFLGLDSGQWQTRFWQEFQDDFVAFDTVALNRWPIHQTKTITTPIRRLDGTVLTAELHRTLIQSDPFPVFMAVVRDASDPVADPAAHRPATHRGTCPETQENLRLLSAAVEQSHEGIAVVDLRGDILYCNDALAGMHGWNPQEVIGSHLSIFHDPAQMQQVEQVCHQVMESGSFHGEIWHIRRDGMAFPTLMHFSVMKNEQREPVGFIATARLMTELKKAHDQWEQLSQAIENAGEGIGTWNQAWQLTYANSALARILGGETPAEVIGRSWASFFDVSETDRLQIIQESLRKKGRWQGRMLGRLPDATRVPLAVTLARLGQRAEDFLVVANIRDRSTEEAHLAQIRKLTTGLDRSIEKERARISRELHDELGQILTALNMNLAWLEAQFTRENPSMGERLAEAKQLVNQTIEAVRRLSTSLRPPILDNQGVLDAIQSHVSEFSRWADIKCRLQATPRDLEIQDPLATTVYRIVQEALTNVARHARATACEVKLKLSNGLLEVKICDNGVGAVPNELEGVQSLGIAGMHERASASGGILTVNNLPGGGVCVMARLPWQAKGNGKNHDQNFDR